MPRRREVPKREILPDPKFHDQTVAKFTLGYDRIIAVTTKHHDATPSVHVVVRFSIHFDVECAVCKRWQPARADGGVQVEGLGGVFFKASDPKALQAWYERHLGLPADANGYINFRWRPAHDPATMAQTEPL